MGVTIVSTQLNMNGISLAKWQIRIFGKYRNSHASVLVSPTASSNPSQSIVATPVFKGNYNGASVAEYFAGRDEHIRAMFDDVNGC